MKNKDLFAACRIDDMEAAEAWVIKMGWKDFAEFELDTGVNFGDVKGCWYCDEDSEISPAKGMGSMRIDEGHRGVFICGMPSRAFISWIHIYYDSKGVPFLDYNEIN